MRSAKCLQQQADANIAQRRTAADSENLRCLVSRLSPTNEQNNYIPPWRQFSREWSAITYFKQRTPPPLV